MSLPLLVKKYGLNQVFRQRPQVPQNNRNNSSSGPRRRPTNLKQVLLPPATNKLHRILKQGSHPTPNNLNTNNNNKSSKGSYNYSNSSNNSYCTSSSNNNGRCNNNSNSKERCNNNSNNRELCSNNNSSKERCNNSTTSNNNIPLLEERPRQVRDFLQTKPPFRHTTTEANLISGMQAPGYGMQAGYHSSSGSSHHQQVSSTQQMQYRQQPQQHSTAQAAMMAPPQQKKSSMPKGVSWNYFLSLAGKGRKITLCRFYFLSGKL